MSSERSYGLLFAFLRIVISPLFPISCTGRENVPEGAALVCANHSSYLDPILLAFAFSRRHHLHFMGKKELFELPLIGWIFRAIGAFGVDRGASDVGAFRTAIRLLRQGKKVMIFPEGTRVRQDDAVAAKAGAVSLASRLKVPVIPVYMQREKRLFRRTRIVIGEPYDVVGEVSGRSRQAEELMEKISRLGSEEA